MNVITIMEYDDTNFENNNDTENFDDDWTNDDSTQCKMSFDDIQVNLRLLCDIKENEKIMLNNKFMMVDQRMLQSVRRYFTSDSRTKTINFIEYTINEAICFCKQIIYPDEYSDKFNLTNDNLEKLMQLQLLLKGTLIGLNRLAITYGNDKLSRAKLETIQANIRTFDELHLKRCICYK